MQKLWFSKHFLFLISTAIMAAGPAIAQKKCESLFSESQTAASKTLETNNYTQDRILSEYNDFFLFSKALSLIQTLKNLRSGSTWFDMGSGRNIAIVKGLETNPQIRRGVSLSAIRSDHALGDQRVPGRLKQMNGDLLENMMAQGRLKNQRGQVDLITDVFGPLSYTSDVRKTLQNYMDLLKENGQLMFTLQIGRAEGLNALDALEYYLPYNATIEADRHHPTGLLRWLQSIPGLNVEHVEQEVFSEDGVFHKTIGIRLTKQTSHIVIPKNLVQKEIAETVPPMRVFYLSSP